MAPTPGLSNAAASAKRRQRGLTTAFLATALSMPTQIASTFNAAIEQQNTQKSECPTVAKRASSKPPVGGAGVAASIDWTGVAGRYAVFVASSPVDGYPVTSDNPFVKQARS